MTTSGPISVIIPTYQRCGSVQRALLALAQQTLASNEYEVIVSIDGSNDGTQELVAQLSVPYFLRAIWQPNQGRAAACNAGIRAAKGILIILLDDDMEPAPDFLMAHQQAHVSTADRFDRLGVLGAVPIVFDRSSAPVVQYIGAKFNQHLAKLAQPDYSLNLRDFYSGNFSIGRSALLEVGAFDESFKIYGNEDLDLSRRLAQAGVRFVYCPEALAYQHYTKDFAALARDNIAKGQTAVQLASKHPDTLPDLKLSTYHQASRKWRLLRTGLLKLSRSSALIPNTMVRFTEWLVRHRSDQLQLYYAFALDYFFWLGVQRALREDDGTSSIEQLLSKPVGRPQP